VNSSQRKKHDKWLFVCSTKQLKEKQFIVLDLLYSGNRQSGIIFKFNGKIFSYLNQCVHMPRRLDCESHTVFDDENNFLRCSMHGIVYAPETGISLSTMCNGRALQALQIKIIGDDIVISDKRISALTSQ